MPPIIYLKKNDVPSVLAEALRLHDHGLSIIACHEKGPIWKDWHARRRSRAELITALGGKNLNIALVLNKCPWIDVECDTPEAEANLQALFGEKIPATPTWQSERGKHRLFIRPIGLPWKAKIEVDGIEFRIANGKAASSVIPPSGMRRWLPGLRLFDIEPAELPEEIVERLRAPVATIEVGSMGTAKIATGKRNDTLFRTAMALHDMKLPLETIIITLLDLNERCCQPPLPESEVRDISASIAKHESKAKSVAIRLIDELELWHDEDNEPYATFFRGDHKENWKIGKHRTFRQFLSKRYYELTGDVLKANVLTDLVSLLEGMAIHDGPSFPVFRRCAEHNAKFYLDLCDEAWRAGEIDENGWRVIREPPIKFRRGKAMLPLPVPVKPAKSLSELLRPFLNVKAEQWPLVLAWLVAAIRPVGPYPILSLSGGQGTAKTTSARILISLLDPNAAPVRAEPRDGRDLMIAANNAWVLCLDNLSFIKAWLSDALCRLCTGGGFATRTLYTDEDETVFDSQRPVILTSIEEIGSRSDLLERTLLIDLPTIGNGARRTEKELWRKFEEARPQILGAILDAVCGAIRNLPLVEGKPDADLSRMADFEQWAEAAEPFLGLQPGAFAKAYAANREAATHSALESSPVITALLTFMKDRPSVEDTASVLLNRLGQVCLDLKRAPGWPKTPRVLSQILKRLAPNLCQIGIVAVQDTRGSGKTKAKVWRIQKVDPTTGEPIQPLRVIFPRRPVQNQNGSPNSNATPTQGRTGC